MALDTRDLRDDQHWHREYHVVIGEPGRRVHHDASRRGTEAARAALDDETVLMRIFAAARVLREVEAEEHVLRRARLARLHPVRARRGRLQYGACPHSAFEPLAIELREEDAHHPRLVDARRREQELAFRKRDRFAGELERAANHRSGRGEMQTLRRARCRKGGEQRRAHHRRPDPRPHAPPPSRARGPS